MLTTIKTLLSKVFAGHPTYQSGLEHFLSSKNPSTPSEIDYWVRVYDQKSSRGTYGY